MKAEEFYVEKHGFRGQLFEPNTKTDKVIIIFMGGEGKIISAGLLAEKLAGYGFAALAIYYYKGQGLSNILSEISLDMVQNAINYLKTKGIYKKIGTYGISLGSILAFMSGVVFDDISCVIGVSATHIIPEGFINKKRVSGKSFLTYKGKEFMYAPLESNVSNFARFQKAYENISNEKVYIPVEKIKGRVLLLAGNDEAWNSAYAAKYMKDRLDKYKFAFPYKLCLYNGSHYIGIIPDMTKHKLLNLVKVFSSVERRNKLDCENARRLSEQEIVNWLREW